VFDSAADHRNAGVVLDRETGADLENLDIAVLIPCLNEEAAIGKVVQDFQAALPQATIYVYDNRSTDRTAEVAEAQGAVVRRESHLGKGNVVRRMFADVEADVYVLVDGDDTYDAASAPALVRQLVGEELDMINAARIAAAKTAYRPGHQWGNRVLTGVASMVFGRLITDMLSGYRVLSRRFVKSFPALSSGFDIEAEMTIHALELRMPIAEVSTPYKDRPTGSASKLKTVQDGMRILQTIAYLVREERPLPFFSFFFVLLTVTSLGLAAPIVIEFIETGLVPRFPTAILTTGVMLLAFLSLTCGLILDTVTLGRREMKRMFYLHVPGTRKKLPDSNQ
jgi:glycosyltransferase involved in cell wall biosynthesis